LQSRNLGLILCGAVLKWRRAMWRMSNAKALIFVAAVVVAVAVMLWLLT
jgi:hypothetical protein